MNYMIFKYFIVCFEDFLIESSNEIWFWVFKGDNLELL